MVKQSATIPASAGRGRRSSRRRAARKNAVLIVLVSATFGLLIAGSAYVARDQVAMMRWASLGGGAGSPGVGESQAPVRLTGAAALGATDPVVRFSETQVGQLLYASTQSDNCRRALFDNKTGSSYQVETIFCGQTLDQAVEEADSNQRIKALRKSFQR
jgi:hypothetical protein